jgi:hypothetical protein
MGEVYLETIKKKAKELSIPLIFWDESGFPLSPIRGTTWCEVGKPIVLRECYSRGSQTGLGMITMTPARQLMKFRFTMFSGSMNTEWMIFFLTMVHYYYGCKKVMIILDSLPAHLSAQKYFERTHPDWFLFEYLPSYSPELNPVEQCWNHMKNVSMANYVPMCREQLETKACEAAQRINDEKKLLTAFFQHAKRSL